MKDVLVVVRAALGDIWDNLLVAAVCNLVWLVCVFLIIPGPLATLALFDISNRLAHGEVVDLHDFVEAMRRNWGLSWRWAIPAIALIAILFGDYQLTRSLSGAPLEHFVQGFYLSILAIWAFIQIYALPFLFEQESENLKLAWRNAAIMLGKNLWFSILLAALLAAILLTGTLLFMLSAAGGGIFLALAGNYAVRNRLEVERFAPGRRS